MVTLDNAKALISAKYPNRVVSTIVHTEKYWIFGFSDRETGLPLDVNPVSVNKQDGKMESFFPPAHRGETVLPITELQVKAEDG